MRDTHRRSARARAARQQGGLSAGLALAVAGGAVGLAALMGRRYSPVPSHPRIDRWYHDLRKPAFTPPDPVFGGVWPALDGLLAFAGYRLLRADPGSERQAALALWLFNLVMLAAWPKLFFAENKIGASLLGAGAMVASGVGYIAAAQPVDRPAALAGIPFVAWLAFAALLTEEVWRQNR